MQGQDQNVNFSRIFTVLFVMLQELSQCYWSFKSMSKANNAEPSLQ